MPHAPTFIRRLLRSASLPLLCVLLGAVLLLAGCADHTSIELTVQPGGAWSGTAVLAWEHTLAGYEHDLLAARSAAILARNDIQSTAALNQAEPGAARYTLNLSGDNAAALAPLLVNARSAVESLDGPVSVVLTGDVTAGEELAVTLPASPSAGLGWMVADGTSGILTPEDSILGSDRQTLLLRASADGPAELHLAYIDLARPDILPTRSVRLTGAAPGLSSLLRAVSLPEPAVPPREPAQGSPDALLPSAPGAPAGAPPDTPAKGCDEESCAPQVSAGAVLDLTVPSLRIPLAMKQGVQTCDLPTYHGFEAATIRQTGWTRVISNTAYTWKIAVVGWPYAGQHFADVEYDSALNTQDEVLLSPAFTADWAELRFYSMGSTYWCRDTNNNCDLKIWLVKGAWGGGDDVLLGKADDSWLPSWAWSPMTIDLTHWLPSGVPVRVAFEYTGRDGAQVGLDEVTIAGACDGGLYASFSEYADNWFSHGGTWYIGSAYLYTYGLAGYFSSASYAGNFSNFIYSARLRRTGCDSCANYIVFRGTPDPLTASYNWYNEYKLQTDRLGNFSVYKRLAGAGSAFKGWSFTPALHLGDAWNTLTAVANGPYLACYINGTLVWNGQDSSLASGRVGVGLYVDSSTGNELQVDWALVTVYP